MLSPIQGTFIFIGIYFAVNQNDHRIYPGNVMSNDCMQQFLAALELAEEMIRMADRVVDTIGDDDGCLVVYGVIKDCAYKIKKVAQRELQTIDDRNDSH